MTVIAWKGDAIGADRCTSVGRAKLESKKLTRHGNSVLATCGPVDFGNALIEWYTSGADPAKYPKYQEREDYATLVVANSRGVFVYYQTPHAVARTAPFGAVGDGAEIALGAMAAGASVQEAIEIANIYCTTCGFGVDVENFR